MEKPLILSLGPEEYLLAGREGWLAWWTPLRGRAILNVWRALGRWQVREIRVRDHRVRPELLRRIPLGRIEAACNAPAIQKELTAAWTYGPDLSEWDFPRIQLAVEDFEDRRRVRIRLRVPTTPKKPDDFYRRVADAYSLLAARGRRPATELAEANSVPPSTVHRWVKEARRRGILASGQRPSDTGRGRPNA